MKIANIITSIGALSFNMSRRTKQKQFTPCLLCGKPSKKQCCSAEHLKQWRAENPGNGRYVHEKWSLLPTAHFHDDTGKLVSERVWICQDVPFSIRTNTAFNNEFALSQYVEVDDSENPEITHQWSVVDIFDCLIDAQRSVAAYAREVRRTQNVISEA